MSPRVFVDSDEWYPVYSLATDVGHSNIGTLDVDDATIARWKAAHDAFNTAQNEIATALDQTEKLRGDRYREENGQIIDVRTGNPVTWE